jgi:carbon-monoxide dehydrogenase medium subunit
MYSFQYTRASSVADAASALSKAEDGKLLAGGQSLVAAMKLRLSRPSDLIDLGRVAELRGIMV